MKKEEILLKLNEELKEKCKKEGIKYFAVFFLDNLSLSAVANGICLRDLQKTTVSLSEAVDALSSLTNTNNQNLN